MTAADARRTLAKIILSVAFVYLVHSSGPPGYSDTSTWLFHERLPYDSYKYWGIAVFLSFLAYNFWVISTYIRPLGSSSKVWHFIYLADSIAFWIIIAGLLVAAARLGSGFWNTIYAPGCAPPNPHLWCN